MGKIEKIRDEYYDLCRKLRKECTEYLQKVLKEKGNHIEWNDIDLDCSLTVSYDGGNHPEYASNCFSTVSAIDLNERGVVTLDTEDCCEYDIGRITTPELLDVCDFVENVYLPSLT